MPHPLVSVIIPTYGHRDFVLDALESVFAQTRGDYEVIVVVDGSPDDTALLLAPLAKSGRIRCIVQENRGQAMARNRGLSLASGEFIAFLDDDDWWPPDKLAWQVEVLRANPSWVAVAGSVRLFRGDGTSWFAGPSEPVLIDTGTLFRQTPLQSPGQLMMRRKALLSCGGFSPEIWGADDLDLWFKLARAGGIYHLPRLALHYRVHERNASRDRARMYDNCRAVFAAHLRAAPARVRAGYRRDAFRWLYEYIGRESIDAGKFAARRADARGLARAAGRLAPLALAAARDPVLGRVMLHDVLPSRLRPRGR